MPAIFISYRRVDATGEARQLRQSLARAMPQVEIFRDISDLPPGVDFGAHIQSVVERCDVVLVLIGKRWAAEQVGIRYLDDPSDWPRREISAALAMGKTVIPILLYGTEMPAETALPDDLKSLTRFNAFRLDDKSWDQDVTELVTWLRKLLLTSGTRSDARVITGDLAKGSHTRPRATRIRTSGIAPADRPPSTLWWSIAAVVLIVAAYGGYRAFHSEYFAPPRPDSASDHAAGAERNDSGGVPPPKAASIGAPQPPRQQIPRLVARNGGHLTLRELTQFSTSTPLARVRNDLQASTDGSLIASVDSDGVTRIIEVKTGREFAKVRGLSDNQPVYSARLAQDGRYLAIADSAGLVAVEDLREGWRLTPEYRLRSDFATMVFVKPQEIVVAGVEGVPTILTMSEKSLQRVSAADRGFGSATNIRAMSMSADGKVLVVADAQGVIQLYSADKSSVGEVVDFGDPKVEVVSVLISDDGKRLAWLSKSHKLTVQIGPDKKLILSDRAERMIFTGDSQYLIASARNVLSVYHASSMTKLATFHENSGFDRLLLAKIGKTPKFALAADSGPIVVFQPQKQK